MIVEFPGAYQERTYACPAVLHRAEYHVGDPDDFRRAKRDGTISRGVRCGRCCQLIFADVTRRAPYSALFVIVEEP